MDYNQDAQTPSTSCPQLTADESINCYGDKNEDNQDIYSQSSCDFQKSSPSLRHHLSGIPSTNVSSTTTDTTKNESGFRSIHSKSLLPNTYSFKRIMSFRGENARKGIVSNNLNVGGAYSPSNHGSSPLPTYPTDHYSNFNTYKPLTFSFLGQIYARRSSKGEKLKQR